LTFEVLLGPKAREDLQDIYDWIANQAGNDVADNYLDRIERVMGKLTEMPNRGTPRDDLVPGLRTIPFERRATITYVVTGQTVEVLRVVHAGRDLRRMFDG
jgi:toxin ParE1/3/4